MSDQDFMSYAIKQAKKAYNPSPNPRVGAVIVKNGKIIAQGFHEKAGSPHAEVVALRKAGKRAFGATLYVTLEPCKLQGRTPPCVEAILKAGIGRVVIGQMDPTKNGGGAKLLAKAGLKVTTNVLVEECRELNQIWLKNVQRNLPYITLKLALDRDGSTIPLPGKRWITGAPARRLVHRIRALHDAILVGSKTVLADDPRLTVRGMKVRQQPVRIVLDQHKRMPNSAKLLSELGEVIHVIGHPHLEPPPSRGRGKSVNYLEIKTTKGKGFDLKHLLGELYSQGITSILVEGGLVTAKHFLKANLVDYVALFFAPNAKIQPQIAENNLKLKKIKQHKVGKDTLMVGFLTWY